VLAIRRNKGMLLVEGDPDCRSAGSFFRNPVLSPQQYASLQQRAASRRLTVPSYPALPPQRANVGLVGDPVEAQHKVSAAWLVEQAGFPKGLTRGAVGISSKHALAIINRGGASAADVLALKAEIERAVCQQFAIELRPEPVFLGFEP
jgi:UDP-N-acetylmuramate dehydrogenase